ncbi:MAG: lipopolysaccharide biosynthesis protein [Candidatus Limisoma sp.]|nr:lipopolysaccharide biosynthesis protein [Candidatus Limisoma sp.]
MAGLKSLLKDTAIYGASSIVGRFLNYLLVPVYVSAMSARSGGYGVVTEIYAWVALAMVILTYGMETTFFRYVNKEEENPKKVYSTTLIMVGFTSLLFVAVGLAFLPAISDAMGYGAHPEYIGMMIGVVAMDAFQSIPFAYLRYRKQPLRFVALKLLFIVLNIAINITYYVGMGGSDVGYAFMFNLICTATIMLLMLPLVHLGGGFDWRLARRMLNYSYPILILGVAGILNQVADKIIFSHVYPHSDAKTQLGIYGAASKIAMIMALLTQAFRYAYEPIVFSKSRDRDSKDFYAKAMKYFVIFTLLAFLCVTFYIDILKYVIAPNPDYWVGLRVVPIVMAAEILMGIYFNLSFWYKLIDKTRWGAVFSFVGCAVLIAINVVFVPRYGYMACAWAGVAGYGVATVVSYVVGQRKYPIAYDIRSIGLYMLVAVVLFAASQLQPWGAQWLRMAVNTALLGVFVAMIIKVEHINLRRLLHRR